MKSIELGTSDELGAVLDLQNLEPPAEDGPGMLDHGGTSGLSLLLCVSPG